MSTTNTKVATTTGDAKTAPPPTFSEIMNKAGKSAVRGGTAGAVAMGANVACLMWMRTTVSYTYIYRSIHTFVRSFVRSSTGQDRPGNSVDSTDSWNDYSL
jgi:hypothetical protein